MPIHTRLDYTVEIDRQTSASITIAADRRMPEVVIPDLPSLLRATLGRGPSNAIVRLTVTSIDFESTNPGDEHLANNDHVAVFLAHGPSPALPKAVKPSTPRYVRIMFVAELWRENASLGSVTGTVSGKQRIGASDREMQNALGSAIDQLAAVLSRALASNSASAVNVREDLPRL